jgi:anti-sigma-K factor RskA
VTLRCEEIDDLVPAYALDALASEDREIVVEHLAECRQHDDDLGDYRYVTSRLPALVPEVSTPALLEASVLDAFDAAASGKTPVLAPVRQLSWPRLLRAPSFAYGLAAALAAVAIGLAAWNATLQDDGTPMTQAIVRSADKDGMKLRVLYLPEQQLAVLNLQMPPLGPERVYQGWRITPGGPVSLGVLQNPGITTFQTDLDDATAIAVSVEPLGGSVAPTSQPLLISEF